MLFREANKEDIQAIQLVRNSVKENVLSDPSLVTDAACEEYISRRGKGWVCEVDGKIIGFAIADLQDHNIWALFVDPDYEARGVGSRLHNMMMNWYFSQTTETVWLSTSPATRAEQFYRKKGWRETGLHGKGEFKFEMNADEWSRIHLAAAQI